MATVERPADEELVARLRAGDDEAFGALVTRHRPWLVRLCTRLLGNDAHAAEDVAQESLLKLHAVAHRDRRPLRVRPWLSVVARRTCVDEHRRRRADLPGELPERPTASDGPFHLDASLAQAWSQLAGRHREVLYLREVLGLSYKEIAGFMDLSLASVETLIFRARAALRREYERAGGRHFGCGILGLGLFGLAAGDRRLQASAHVVSCDHCRQAVDGLRSAGNLLRASAPAADVVSTIGTRLPSGAGGGLDLGAGLDIGGLSQRAMHMFAATLPDGGQSVARLLSTAAGVVMAAASVIPAVVVPGAPARPGGNGEVVAAESGPATGRRTELASGWNGGGAYTTVGSDRPAQPAWSDGLASGPSDQDSAGGRTDSAALGDKPRASVNPGKAPRRTGRTPVESVDRPKPTPAPRPVLAPTTPAPDVTAPPRPSPPSDPVTPPDGSPTADPDVPASSPAPVPEAPEVPPAPDGLADPPPSPGRGLIGSLGQAVPIFG